MLKFLNQSFPFFLNDHYKNGILVLLTSIFVSLFLTVYVPFGDYNSNILNNIAWGILCFSMLYINLVLLPKLLPSVFDLSRWTLSKYLLFNLWLFLITGTIFSIVNSLFFCGNLSYPDIFLKTQREVVLTGIIPLIIVTIFAKNNLLRQNLTDAVLTNRKLQEIQKLRERSKELENQTTLYTDTSEIFSFNLTDLAFIVARDNYSEIYWYEDNRIPKKLLRVTLKNIETQLTNQFIVRCHRSYLVNIKAIANISGNTNGYKLYIRNSEMEIPVSRAKGKEIIRHINQIRDVMDIL